MPEVDIDDSTVCDDGDGFWGAWLRLFWWRWFVVMALVNFRAGLPINIV